MNGKDLIEHYQKKFEKLGYKTSYTNYNVLMCINSKKLKAFNYHIKTNTFKYFKYQQKTYTPRVRMKPLKAKKVKFSKGIYINSIFPNKNIRNTFYIIIRMYRETFIKNDKQYFITQAQLERCICYLKSFKLLPRKEIEQIISRYRPKSIIDYYINELEKHSLVEHKCYIYLGRKYLCYKYYHHALKFTLLSARLMHHMITINGVSYYPTDILKSLKPYKYKIIHNYFRYRMANVIGEYVETLDKQIIQE